MSSAQRYFACHADDGTSAVLRNVTDLHKFVDCLEGRGDHKTNWRLTAVSSLGEAEEWLRIQQQAKRRKIQEPTPLKALSSPSLPSSRPLQTQNQPSVHVVINVYTDGACSKNGQAGASAGIGVYFQESCDLNSSLCMPFLPATNQRAELAAVLCALVLCEKDDSREKNISRQCMLVDQFKGMAGSETSLMPHKMKSAVEKWIQSAFSTLGPSSTKDVARGLGKFIEDNYWSSLREMNWEELAKACIGAIEARVCVWTDSHYAAKCASEWAEHWEKNGWKAKNGQNPMNMDLIKAIRQLLKERQCTRCEWALWRGKCEFKYVAGHSGDTANDTADFLANRGAKLLDNTPYRKQDLAKILEAQLCPKETLLKLLEWKESRVSLYRKLP